MQRIKAESSPCTTDHGSPAGSLPAPRPLSSEQGRGLHILAHAFLLFLKLFLLYWSIADY